MTKFRYNEHSSVALKEAKRGRNVVYTVRGLIGLLPVGATVALIMLTPPMVWGTILGIILVVGGVGTLIEKGDSIAYWYNQHKYKFEKAKASGVRDE